LKWKAFVFLHFLRQNHIYNIKGQKRAREEFFKLTDAMALSGRKVVQSLSKTLMKWSTEILYYFRAKITNGRTEGYNRKVKIIQRKAYGYRNIENYRLRLPILTLLADKDENTLTSFEYWFFRKVPLRTE
jgi:transposase